VSAGDGPGGRAYREYQDALAYLYARTGGHSTYGLGRTRALLAAMGDPHLAVPTLHVAGTNGKGSTVATLVALLAAGGRRVAAYTSPHLVDFRERVVVGGRPIPAAEVAAFVARWTPEAERLGATFFEVTTAMAFDHFARAGADVAVVEVGLGGRLDSTNVVEPLVAGVTSIGLDHTELLGDTLDAIAGEKAGIYKAGAPAVVGEWDPHVRAVLAGHARAAGASAVRVVAEECEVEAVEVGPGGTAFTLRAPFAPAGLRLCTPLAGRYQAENVATALTMLDAAGPPWRPAWDDVGGLLARTRLAGRLHREGRYLFDVAHNPDGARALVAALPALGLTPPVTALVAVLADKDWRGILGAIGPAVDRLVLTTAPTAPAGRVWSPGAAADFARARGWAAEVVPNFDAALARAAEGGGTVLVTGSFHTVGDAMARLQVSPLAT
jgi:dihydrofolate synthase/folylpolyglutamate synthase